MKDQLLFRNYSKICTCFLALGILIGLSHPLAAAEAGLDAKNTKIGVYDSRSVALAYGRSKIHNEQVNKLVADAKLAETSGDKKRLAELKKEGAALQDKLHRQVFGDAAIGDILEVIKNDLSEILKKAKVGKIVSQAERGSASDMVDVTSFLVQHFEPTEQTLKMIEDLKKHPPLKPNQFPIKD